MSSYYSTITVPTGEWERMQLEINSASAYQIQSQQEIARLQALELERRQELSRIQEANRQTVGRATDYINVAFRNNLDRLSDSARATLASQTARFDEQIGNLRSQASRLDARLTAASATIESIAQQYHDVFQSILGGVSRAQGRAEYVLAELDRFLERIEGLNPERFAADEYSALLLLRANTASNIANGDYQTALIVSQSGILDASRLLTRLIAFNEQYDAMYADVRGRLNALQGRMDNLASREGVISLNVGDEPMEFDYDIAYWSHGIYDEISSAVSMIAERLERGAKTPISIADLGNLGRRIDALNDQLTRCDEEARRDLVSAITVDDTVSRLHNCLENRGWTLEESGRVDDDNRKPYSLVYGDGEGNTVSFVIAAGSDPKTPALFYEAFADDSPTANVIKEGMGAALETEGLQARNTVRRNDCSSNASPEAFIHNIERETEQMTDARINQVRNTVGI